MAVVLYKNLLVDFECPVCTEYMEPPIGLCITGHSFCSKCFQRLRNCPQCRKERGTARNYVLESLFEKLILPCRYHYKGCNFSDIGSQIRIHEQICIFAIKPCPLKSIDNCTWTGAKKDILKHCKVNHPRNTYSTNYQKLTWANFANPRLDNSKIYLLIDTFGELFNCVWILNIDTMMIKWGVYMLGKSERAKRFSFEIKIEDPLHHVVAISHRMPCSAIQNDGMLAIDDANCILTHFNMLKQYCSVNGHLIYSIEIIEYPQDQN